MRLTEPEHVGHRRSERHPACAAPGSCCVAFVGGALRLERPHSERSLTPLPWPSPLPFPRSGRVSRRGSARVLLVRVAAAAVGSVESVVLQRTTAGEDVDQHVVGGAASDPVHRRPWLLRFDERVQIGAQLLSKVWGGLFDMWLEGTADVAPSA
jgi:hypothetical protein